jgi:hypothetical protein
MLEPKIQANDATPIPFDFVWCIDKHDNIDKTMV